MTNIIVTHEDNQTDEYTFESTQDSITIGRRSSNDVCVPNLSVSGKHARITRVDRDTWIEDLNSTNGTYVNGRLISRQLLGDRDDVIIGKIRLTISSDQQDTLTYPGSAEDVSAATGTHEAATANQPGSPGYRQSGREFSSDASLGDSMDEEFAFTHGDHEVAVREAPAQELAGKPVAAAAAAAASAAATVIPGHTGNNTSDRRPVVQDDDRLPDASMSDDDEPPMSLTERAKLALGRSANQPHAGDQVRHNEAQLAAQGLPRNPSPAPSETMRSAAEQRAHLRPVETRTPVSTADDSMTGDQSHPLDGLEDGLPTMRQGHSNNTESPAVARGAVIEIKNGAKTGQILPIDKPVTTLGRPGIQIAAIMRKPDGYFLMHIESDDSVDPPTLNHTTIADEPVLLHSGDELNVAGIDVEFMLS